MSDEQKNGVNLTLRDIVPAEKLHILDSLEKGDGDNLLTYSDENANFVLNLEYRYQRMVRLWGDTLQYHASLHTDIRKSLNGAAAQYVIYRTKGKYDMLVTYLNEFEQAMRGVFPGIARKESI